MATHKVQGVTQILKLDLFSNTNIKGIIKLYKFQIPHISYTYISVIKLQFSHHPLTFSSEILRLSGEQIHFDIGTLKAGASGIHRYLFQVWFMPRSSVSATYSSNNNVSSYFFIVNDMILYARIWRKSLYWEECDQITVGACEKSKIHGITMTNIYEAPKVHNQFRAKPNWSSMEW